jgi:hypothetical protein
MLLKPEISRKSQGTIPQNLWTPYPQPGACTGGGVDLRSSQLQASLFPDPSSRSAFSSCVNEKLTQERFGAGRLSRGNWLPAWGG